jgi:hypothetical protein
MTRGQLEHVIRASGAIAEVDRLVILGSQAILGAFPDAPAELLTSLEADIYPPDRIERADLIDGSIGEDSLFHETFGYYAHGVGPETALLPARWQSRLVSIQNENTNRIEGLCLSPADLAVSKLLAGREKDVAFVRSMIRYDMLTADAITAAAPELSESLRRRLLDTIRLL